jgi:cold shock CspA family protein
VSPETDPEAPAEPLPTGDHHPAEAYTARSGVVATFDDAEGAGTIVDDATGAAWWFHCTRIADGSRSIPVATPVTFTAAPGPTGLEAVDVTPAPVP